VLWLVGKNASVVFLEDSRIMMSGRR